MADGLSNKALDELLSILHDPECDLDQLPSKSYYLEQIQNRALAPFILQSSRWRILTKDNGSEEIIFVDIADMLQQQLKDPNIAQSIIIDSSQNNGIISHPSHAELWRNLQIYDSAKALIHCG